MSPEELNKLADEILSDQKPSLEKVEMILRCLNIAEENLVDSYHDISTRFENLRQVIDFFKLLKARIVRSPNG